MAAEDQADGAKELVPLSLNQNPKGETGSCSRMSDMLSTAGNSHNSEWGIKWGQGYINNQSTTVDTLGYANIWIVIKH